MNASRSVVVRSAICAAALFITALPGSVFAQASGAPAAPGVSTQRLPRTGGEPVEAAAPGGVIAAVVLAGGAALAGLEVRRRSRREPERRRR